MLNYMVLYDDNSTATEHNIIFFCLTTLGRNLRWDFKMYDKKIQTMEGAFLSTAQVCV